MYCGSAFVSQWVDSLPLFTNLVWVGLMGTVEDESVTESQIPDHKKKSVLFAVIMLILGLFAPILIDAWNTNSSSPDVFIQGIFWMYRFKSSQYIAAGFYIIFDSSSLIVMFPFFMLRMIPAVQIYRYYNRETTRIRVFIASIVGDGLILFMGLMMAFSSLVSHSDTFHMPLPLQIIFSLFALLIFRVPKPTDPWKSSKSWWEKEPEDQEGKQEKRPAKDDNDMLW